MKLTRQFLRFSVIGAIGFIVDVSVLYLMLYFGLDLYVSRAISFVMAATATWIGNRVYTFRTGIHKQGRLGNEWVIYLIAMSLGGLVNYVTYALLVTFIPLFQLHPWLAVAGGTGAGLLINFILARRILYKGPV